ncbi:MAG TPA: DNA repair protein RecN [Cytophagaceae bacterium]|nr:DNA repair protein RecN [Cytophagaceae bacterium]
MLKNLLIRNYALISKLEMSPSSDLNIVTGETGAGKSIMLGAAGLLLGNRADTKVLLNPEEKCVIEGTFDISQYKLKNIFDEEELDYDEQCIIRREISPQNKSRAFVNDTPVTLDVLKKLGVYLMDVHSQHETLLLGNALFQIKIIDAYAKNQNISDGYKELFRNHAELNKKYERLVKTSEEAHRQMDYNNFQLTELTEAVLISGEQEKLEEELKLLENSEEIKSKLNLALQLLSGEGNSINLSLRTVEKYLEQLSPFSKNYEELKQRLSAAFIELKDVEAELEKEESSVELGQERTEQISERLSTMYSLQKKHQVKTVDELLVIQNVLQEKMSSVENLEEEIAGCKKQLEDTYKNLLSKGEELSKSRNKVTDKIKDELEALLKEVGMPASSIKITMERIAPGITGLDQISILFSANKGIAPQELKSVASGGEFSRLMLCIKYMLASKTAMPTIIFDEIDTGISGEIAIKVGRMMKQMAKGHQVIAISHLPQIAAQGSRHYFVYKDVSSGRASSKIRELSEEERVKEIAQMIGGEKPSETAIKNARELLAIN